MPSVLLICSRPFRKRLAILLVSSLSIAAWLACDAPTRSTTDAARNQPPNSRAFALAPGDLLFQDLDCGPICAAIEAVTTGVDGYAISHIGLIVDRRTAAKHPVAQAVLKKSHAQWFVLEALSPAVRLTPLFEFLNRSQDATGNPKVLVGRLLPAYQPLVPTAIERGLGYLGTPYDEKFEMDDETLYCSEMIHFLLAPTTGGSSIFPTAPMTFLAPQTRRFFPVWINYFEQLGVPIPEGKPGINPAAISRAPELHLVHQYGHLDLHVE